MFFLSDIFSPKHHFGHVKCNLRNTSLKVFAKNPKKYEKFWKSRIFFSGKIVPLDS